MSTLTEGDVIKIMRDEYRLRLIETLGESDIYDSHDNMLLSPGLKVRHKDSSYEYTVDSVSGENPDDLQIRLRLPDEPRFEPPAQGEPIMNDVVEPNVLGEVDPTLISRDPTSGIDDELVVHGDPAEAEGDIFIIDREEFEREYEVQ
jgi:hypothetical protein